MIIVPNAELVSRGMRRSAVGEEPHPSGGGA